MTSDTRSSPRHIGFPAAEQGARPAPGARVNWLARVVSGLLMYAAAAWLMAENSTFRSFEARTVTPFAALITGNHPVVAQTSIVYFAMGTPRAFGLNITTECTSALLLIPLLVMVGSFAAFTRLSLRRELIALAVGALLLMAVNTIRVAGIAWATWQFGFDPGYKYSHVFVGSAFSLIGFVAAILIALWLMVRGDRPGSRTLGFGERSTNWRPPTFAAPTPDRDKLVVRTPARPRPADVLPVTRASDSVEATRRLSIASYGLDRPFDPAQPDTELQRLTRLGQWLVGGDSGAVIVLLEHDELVLSGSGGAVLGRTPRSAGLCSRLLCTLPEPEIHLVADACQDPLLSDSPLVNRRPAPIRFYASAPLISPEGVPLGSLAVWSARPGTPTEHQRACLADISHAVMMVLEARRRVVADAPSAG